MLAKTTTPAIRADRRNSSTLQRTRLVKSARLILQNHLPICFVRSLRSKRRRLREEQTFTSISDCCRWFRVWLFGTSEARLERDSCHWNKRLCLTNHYSIHPIVFCFLSSFQFHHVYLIGKRRVYCKSVTTHRGWHAVERRRRTSNFSFEK